MIHSRYCDSDPIRELSRQNSRNRKKACLWVGSMRKHFIEGLIMQQIGVNWGKATGSGFSTLLQTPVRRSGL